MTIATAWLAGELGFDAGVEVAALIAVRPKPYPRAGAIVNQKSAAVMNRGGIMRVQARTLPLTPADRPVITAAPT